MAIFLLRVLLIPIHENTVSFKWLFSAFLLITSVYIKQFQDLKYKMTLDMNFRILIVMMTITYRKIYDNLDTQWK